MPDILHRVGIKSPDTSQAYAALTTLEGLASWWTSDTMGQTTVGGITQFRFGAAGGFDTKVVALEPNERVVWEVIDGPSEWIGTRIAFDLKQEGENTIILFKHLDWREPVEFMHHCSTKWATFLLSIKSLIETGRGNPHPYDTSIDNWN